jgi:hypothetical protein
MDTPVTVGRNPRFKTGWILLLVIAALMTINHLSLLFVLSEPTLFAGFAAFNLYACVVLAMPFRRHEPWAWYASWILPIGLAAPGFTNSAIAIYYFAAAALCVVGLLLTMHDFFAADRKRQAV